RCGTIAVSEPIPLRPLSSLSIRPTVTFHHRKLPMSASAFSDEPRAATIRLSGRLVICSADPRAQQRLAEIVFVQSSETCTTSTIDELKSLLPHEEFSVCILDVPHSAADVADLERIARPHHQPTQFIVLPAVGQRDQYRSAGLQMCEV